MVYQKDAVFEINAVGNEIFKEGVYTIQINTTKGENIFSRLVVTR